MGTLWYNFSFFYIYWFEKQVCKYVVKAFSNQLYGCKNNERNFLQVERECVPFIWEQRLRTALRYCQVYALVFHGCWKLFYFGLAVEKEYYRGI